jgi:hypothetical protein
LDDNKDNKDNNDNKDEGELLRRDFKEFRLLLSVSARWTRRTRSFEVKITASS